jgi:hypothetical protein
MFELYFSLTKPFCLNIGLPSADFFAKVDCQLYIHILNGASDINKIQISSRYLKLNDCIRAIILFSVITFGYIEVGQCTVVS